jgi:truncated hemoglobin YjbI
MPTVERTQISLEPAQAARLRRLAREQRTSMAALIREAVDKAYPAAPTRDELWDRALEAARTTAVRSGLPDLAEEHDRYLGEDGRW